MGVSRTFIFYAHQLPENNARATAVRPKPTPWDLGVLRYSS